MKNLVFAMVMIMLAGCQSLKTNRVNLLVDATWVDLTWAFDENSVYWPTNVPFRHDTVFEGINDKGYYYSSFKFSAEEHGGTHFDAPVHFAEGGLTVDQVQVDRLIGEGILVDVSARAEENRDYLISVEDFLNWEQKHGRIPVDVILLVKTGFGKFYPDKERYTGTSLTGQEGVDNLHFPGLDPVAAEWLVTERKIKAFGLDTPSIDYGQSKEFMTHRILFAHGLTAYENLAHLDKLPPRGFFVMALPMKIRGGSGAPLRIVAAVYSR